MNRERSVINDSPLVSIVIGLFNGGKTIVEALDSIRLTK